MPKAVRSEVTGDRQISQLQANIAGATQQLRDGPFGEGNLVTGISLAAVPSTATNFNVVNTGLDKPLSGWVLCRIVGLSASAIAETTHDDRLGTVTFSSSGTVTCSIWFF